MVAFSSTLIAFLSLGVFTLTVMVAEPYNQEIGINYNNNMYLVRKLVTGVKYSVYYRFLPRHLLPREFHF